MLVQVNKLRTRMVPIGGPARDTEVPNAIEIWAPRSTQKHAGPGQFNGVWGVSTDSDGFVYVADTNNRRVQKLDANGVFVAEWTNYRGSDFTKPTGVYVDHEDVVYVCDSLAEVVALFETDGSFLGIWDLRAIYGERSEPEDIVISADGTNVYVAEVFGHRVLRFARQ